MSLARQLEEAVGRSRPEALNFVFASDPSDPTANYYENGLKVRLGFPNPDYHVEVSGGSFGGSDFSAPTVSGSKPRVIRTIDDAMEALHKAKRARATAVKERDQATATASVQAEIVAEYDEAIVMLEKWIADNRGR